MHVINLVKIGNSEIISGLGKKINFICLSMLYKMSQVHLK
jgi:hypothetical protein